MSDYKNEKFSTLLKKEYSRMHGHFTNLLFWADMLVYFCIFSIVGHLVEIPYCLFNDHFFGIIPEDSGVWGYPMEPFIVYGLAALVLIMFVLPLYRALDKKIGGWKAIVALFVVCVFVSMLMELVMGLIFNQPVDGVYPLWDNSTLPGNIFKQAWIVNDVLLGILCVVFICFLYPVIQRALDRLSKPARFINCAIVVALFIVNMYITYGIFHE